MMHVRIEIESRRGLRVIEEIPDIPLSRIEGYNGIGKTNAIKVLRLCTGEQPFGGDSQSWRSFRDQLVSGRVEVSGLRDGRRIEWQLTPERWPDMAEPLGELLGSIRIDGKSALSRDVKQILKVHHIIAADTPLSVLAHRVDGARRHLSDWVGEIGGPRQEKVELALGAVQKKILQSLPAQVQPDLQAATEANARVEEISADLEKTKRQASTLDRAVEVSDRLDQVRGRGPEMDSKIKELQAGQQRVEAKKTGLDKQITEASSKKHSDDAAEKEFELARKHLIRQEKSLLDKTEALSRLAAMANVESNKDDIAKERALLGARLSKLSALLPQVNATPMIISALDDIIQRLRDAEAHDLGGSTLLEPMGSREGWTVSDLREACSAQIETLSQRRPSGEAQNLSAEIASIRQKLDALATAGEVMDEIDQLQQNFNKAAERLRVASDKLPEQTARTLDDLIRTRNEVDLESRSLQAQIARLEHARELLGGGLTEGALAAELVRLCKESATSPARVRGRREQIRSELDSLTRQHVQATQNMEQTRRKADARLSQVQDVTTYVISSDELSWLREAYPVITRFDTSSIESLVSGLQRLAEKIEVARNSLSRNYSSILGLGASLLKLGEHLRNPTDVTMGATGWDHAARLWLAEDVRRWFDDSLIREALFDSASEIRLDADNMMVHWQANGEPMSRSLLGFSSGEQAFAYTHAQVAQLEHEVGSSENRLIALDEFGSFLDADRMDNLISYLANRQTRVATDQVVVIVPLETSSTTMLSATPESAMRIRDLERRGYFVETLSA